MKKAFKIIGLVLLLTAVILTTYSVCKRQTEKKVQIQEEKSKEPRYQIETEIVRHPKDRITGKIPDLYTVKATLVKFSWEYPYMGYYSTYLPTDIEPKEVRYEMAHYMELAVTPKDTAAISADFIEKCRYEYNRIYALRVIPLP